MSGCDCYFCLYKALPSSAIGGFLFYFWVIFARSAAVFINSWSDMHTGLHFLQWLLSRLLLPTLPTRCPQDNFSGRCRIQTAFSESFPIRPAATFLEHFNIFFLAKTIFLGAMFRRRRRGFFFRAATGKAYMRIW